VYKSYTKTGISYNFSSLKLYGRSSQEYFLKKSFYPFSSCVGSISIALNSVEM